MFFDHPKIREILKEYFGWTEEVIQAMQLQYTSTISRLVLDESMLFIEQHNLPENDELAKMLQEAKPVRGDLNTEVKLMQFVAEIPAKYPELQEKIKKLIGDIQSSLFSDFVDAMDEATKIKILTIANDDLTKMDKLANDNPDIFNKTANS